MTDKEQREALGIPVGADVTYIDMGPGKVERKTAGFTDAQISEKTLAEIDAMIHSGQLAIDKLRETVRDQEDRVNGYRRIRERKVELG
jgi:hypothetical protein